MKNKIQVSVLDFLLVLVLVLFGTTVYGAVTFAAEESVGDDATQGLNVLQNERIETDDEVQITVYLDEESSTTLSVAVPKDYGYLLEDFAVRKIPQEKSLSAIYITGSRYLINNPNRVEMKVVSEEDIAEIRFCKENEGIGEEVCRAVVTTNPTNHEWKFDIPNRYHDGEMEILKKPNPSIWQIIKNFFSRWF